MKPKKASIRFKEFTDKTNGPITVGRLEDPVIAFEFRNEGDNSNMRVTKDGAGFTLAPGEEKPFALDGNVTFHEQFVVHFSKIKPADPATHLGVLTEMYFK